MLEALEKVLDARVRPALHSHGGTVAVLGLDEAGTLRVRLGGQCSGCPAAALTTETLIEKEVTEALPHIKRVVLIQPVSEDLLDQARALLRHG